MKITSHKVTTTLKFFILCTVVLGSFSLKSATETIFRDWTWNSVKDAGTIYHRPLVVFVYSSTCIQSKNTFSEFNTTQVSQFYNKNFLCNKMDATKIKDFVKASSWGVTSVPTVLFFNANSKLVYKVEGYQNRTQLLNAAISAKKIMNDELAKTQLNTKSKNNSSD